MQLPLACCKSGEVCELCPGYKCLLQWHSLAEGVEGLEGDENRKANSMAGYCLIIS